ncbi:hypothetical protein ICC18_25790 [Paenibacillus sp. WST5]|uniref:Uncharacterized protein n=2 Tax=Paenibacillus sedimenti TaxID=2770274 RepID=A0A926KUR6_9BACL|nr:hypothetical protein [Paenibacillus sedimenti]
MNKSDKIEKLLWSIALPGFGQLLNRKYVKGLTLIILEIIVNINSNLNDIIIDSFKGNIQAAVQHTDYNWLMFYPCLYMFGIWDAYKDGGDTAEFAYIPFVLGAFLGTVGIIYSDVLRPFNILFGPVWLPMIFSFVGNAIGITLFLVLRKLRIT